MGFMHLNWLGWNTAEKEAVTTEPSVVPVSCSVTLKAGISFFSGLSCQFVSQSL